MSSVNAALTWFPYWNVQGRTTADEAPPTHQHQAELIRWLYGTPGNFTQTLCSYKYVMASPP